MIPSRFDHWSKLPFSGHENHTTHHELNLCDPLRCCEPQTLLQLLASRLVIRRPVTCPQIVRMYIWRFFLVCSERVCPQKGALTPYSSKCFFDAFYVNHHAKLKTRTHFEENKQGSL